MNETESLVEQMHLDRHLSVLLTTPLLARQKRWAQRDELRRRLHASPPLNALLTALTLTNSLALLGDVAVRFRSLAELSLPDLRARGSVCHPTADTDVAAAAAAAAPGPGASGVYGLSAAQLDEVARLLIAREEDAESSSALRAGKAVVGKRKPSW